MKQNESISKMYQINEHQNNQHNSQKNETKSSHTNTKICKFSVLHAITKFTNENEEEKQTNDDEEKHTPKAKPKTNKCFYATICN